MMCRVLKVSLVGMPIARNLGAQTGRSEAFVEITRFWLKEGRSLSATGEVSMQMPCSAGDGEHAHEFGLASLATQKQSILGTKTIRLVLLISRSPLFQATQRTVESPRAVPFRRSDCQ
jgi:hypothetical protein